MNGNRSKITVLKLCEMPEIDRQYPAVCRAEAGCGYFHAGQEFICHKAMPEGFCPWAWDDVYRFVVATLWESKYSETIKGCRNDYETIVCCTCGLHPVSFLIEPAVPMKKDKIWFNARLR